MLLSELVAKQLEILKETIIGATQIGVNDAFAPIALKSIEAAAEKAGIRLQLVPVRTIVEIDAAMSLPELPVAACRDFAHHSWSKT
jgi:hypothetical protein